MKDKSEDKQVVTRLKRRIKKLKYVNKRDLQEMAERGKEIVEMAKIVRGCENQISAEGSPCTVFSPVYTLNRPNSFHFQAEQLVR